MQCPRSSGSEHFKVFGLCDLILAVRVLLRRKRTALKSLVIMDTTEKSFGVHVRAFSSQGGRTPGAGLGP